MQAVDFCQVPYLKGFWTSQLEFEMVELYKNILILFTDNEWFYTSWGLLFNKFGNLSIYYIWNIQASKFGSLPYLKCFGRIWKG